MPKKQAPPSPRRDKGTSFSVSAAESTVTLECDVRKEGLRPIMGSAYLLTDRAVVALRGDKARALTVVLRLAPPSSTKALVELGETFLRELETQKVRWAIAENNQSVREFVAQQAVLLANGSLKTAPPPGPSAPVSEELTAAQRKEIEKLIAEVEGEIRDINLKKSGADPKNIKATWEEKHPSLRPTKD